MDDEWDDYESGPFCKHWDNVGACDELCKCGHRCGAHDHWDGGCYEDGCECKAFEDAEKAT